MGGYVLRRCSHTPRWWLELSCMLIRAAPIRTVFVCTVFISMTGVTGRLAL